MGAPIDRTAKTAMDLNLVNGVTSDAPKLKASDNVLYDYVDGLNAAQDAHSGASTLAHPDGSVKTAKIADGAVTTAKIADLAVTAAKVANGSLTADKFIAGALQNETQNGLEIAALKADTTHNLYVNVSGGSDTNDGLSAGSPFSTLQKAFTTISQNAYRMDVGTWIINLAAGTYTEMDVTLTTPSRNRVVIKGPDVGGHPNVPTCIFNGTGGANYVHGIRISGIGVRAEVKDIKFINFTGANTRIGLVGENESDLLTTNVHADNCDWCGIYAFNTVRARISGGILNNCRSGFIANSTQCSIGYGASSTAQGTIITNSSESGIYWSRGSQGHIDYCVINDNAIGILLAENSRADTVSNDFKRNAYGIRTQTGGCFGEGGSVNIFNNGTADANTQNLDYKAVSGNTDELRLSTSWVRTAYDRALRTVTGTTPTTLTTPYVIKANRLLGAGKQCRVHALGIFTAVTAGSAITVNFGGMAFAVTVPAAGSNIAFELDVTLLELEGGYRSIGKITQGLNGLRYASTSAGFSSSTDQTISIATTLAGAGDTINIYRTDVYLMG